MRELLKGITVSDDEAQKFYDDNKNSFMQPEKVHARHILISGDADELAAKIIADLKAGASFDVLAKEYSLDPGSKANGGDLGEFPRGVMVPDFEKAAFALKNPGDISEPVKSQFGLHIIKLEAKIPAAPTPFEQVKPRIMQELREKKTQELLKARSEELEKIYKVERF
ncbi:MAG: peptidylprolyl isomerase [Synergistaceae bacterium]|nr:peptidylprolyl isomerase [Synergistaceae bacterium]